jgi:hypothetical protein
MSDDPETRRQIAELARDTRPLLVLDVDEVVLEFVGPFVNFLDSQGLDFRAESFRLIGNVYDRESGAEIEKERVSALLSGFFEEQAEWQAATEGAADAVGSFANDVEIVLLTAMPHQYREKRRMLLESLGFPYPLVTTEAAKGPAIRALRGDHPRPVAFVDDILRNLMSVHETLPDAGLLHLMAHHGLRALMPPLPEFVIAAEHWRDARVKIAHCLGL